MGYGYNFQIAVEEINLFYDFYKDQIKEAYQQLKDREWFPIFGETEFSSSGGYGTGACNTGLLEELILLTSQFPNLTFVIFYSWWDNTNLSIYRLRGDILLDEEIINLDELTVGRIGYTLSFEVASENDITQYLT